MVNNCELLICCYIGVLPILRISRFATANMTRITGIHIMMLSANMIDTIATIIKSMTAIMPIIFFCF